MLNFRYVKFKNFMSYGNVWTKFKFENSETFLICGENGVGKSSIIEAVVYGCYGKSLSGIKDDKLINNINESGLEVEVEFEKDNNIYRINRGRKTDNGNFVKIFKNSEEISLDSITHTNKKIAEIINISYELFIRIVIFSANHIPFFELSPRSGSVSQSMIIEELFQLLELADNAEKLKLQTKENSIQLQIEQAKIEQIERNKELLKNDKEKAKQRVIAWYKNHKLELKNLKDKAKSLNEVDLDLENEKEIHTKLQELNEHLSKIEHKLDELISNRTSYENNKTKLTNELESLADNKCPYCKQYFKEDDLKIDKIKSAIKIFEKLLLEITEKIEEETNKTDIIATKLEKTKTELTILDINELDTIILEKNTINDLITTTEKNENPHIEAYDEISTRVDTPIDYKITNELIDNIEHQKFLYKLLTNKNSFIRKSLLNKHIPYLNIRLNEYLKAMELDYTVKFSHDLTANIKKMGKTLDFGNLSNGQRARVNIALSLSFKDMLQTIHGQINICVLDEILDKGLDPIGTESVVKLLKKKAKDEKVAIYVITHRSEIDNIFDNIIKISIDNNFSKIESYN